MSPPIYQTTNSSATSTTSETVGMAFAPSFEIMLLTISKPAIAIIFAKQLSFASSLIHKRLGGFYVQLEVRYTEWVNTVLADFDTFLLDHAACERKVQQMQSLLPFGTQTIQSWSKPWYAAQEMEHLRP